ncbi:ribosomal protein 1 [Striga asiatica]|uniref:Ribosomal protein 1 n=1 Tax=Striga asiatica TaxID=4170 RepID=A0A5A7Q9H9_STRAF|nr:ribosomal protein 1 [Striga asiatica]
MSSKCTVFYRLGYHKFQIKEQPEIPRTKFHIIRALASADDLETPFSPSSMIRTGINLPVLFRLKGKEQSLKLTENLPERSSCGSILFSGHSFLRRVDFGATALERRLLVDALFRIKERVIDILEMLSPITSTWDVICRWPGDLEYARGIPREGIWRGSPMFLLDWRVSFTVFDTILFAIRFSQVDGINQDTNGHLSGLTVELAIAVKTPNIAHLCLPCVNYRNPIRSVQQLQL